MKHADNKFLLAAIVLLLAACKKDRLPGITPVPVNNNPASGPNDSKLISRIYLINVLPAGPDTATEVTLKHDLLGRLLYTTSKNWRNPAAALQYVSYFYNGADTLPSGITHYYGSAVTKTVFNNYVNGLLKSDSSLSYNAAGVLSEATSTVFLTGASLIKSRTNYYRISNGAPSTVLFRDSLICRIISKDNNNNPLILRVARSDNPVPGFTNSMVEHTNTFDAGINPLYYYFRHGNTVFDPVSPLYEEGVVKLLAVTNWYPKNDYLSNNPYELSQINIFGVGNYTYINQYDAAGRATGINQTFKYPFFSLVQTTRVAFVYQYP
jgi:hypothetical protein